MLAKRGYGLLRFSGDDAAFVSMPAAHALMPRFAPDGFPMSEFHCYRQIMYHDVYIVMGDQGPKWNSYFVPLHFV